MDGIVVGIDESDHSRAALRWSAEHARIEGRPLTAVMAWGSFFLFDTLLRVPLPRGPFGI